MLLRCQFRKILFGKGRLHLGTASVHSKYFSTCRYLYNEAKQPSPTTPTNKQGQNIWQLLEPCWKTFKSQVTEIRSVLNRYNSQFSYHAEKAKEAIREANKKIAEQEREGNDQRLNYNKDVETSGKIEDLPSQRELHRRKWSRKLEFYLDSLQETIFTATRALNDVTGYSSIQRLRKSIDLMEKTLEGSRVALTILKEKYADAIEERTKSQKELNELLQRKNSWSPVELERFTVLYKNDATNLKREQQLKEEVRIKEAKQEEVSDDLYRAILTRYHEEQIWSDKIRRTSTWGTFILMGVNIMLFLVFQLLLEPWKRRRLTRSFEDKVKAALDQYAVDQNLKLAEMSANLNKEVNASKLALGSTPEMRDDTLQNLSDDQHTFVEKDHSLNSPPFMRPKISIRSLLDWIEELALKFRPSTLFQVHSQTTMTNLQLYVYSSLLLIIGALSTSFI